MEDQDYPEVPKYDSARHEQMKRRNRALGLALFAFVVILGVVSYYRVGSLMP